MEKNKKQFSEFFIQYLSEYCMNPNHNDDDDADLLALRLFGFQDIVEIKKRQEAEHFFPQSQTDYVVGDSNLILQDIYNGNVDYLHTEQLHLDVIIATSCKYLQMLSGEAKRFYPSPVEAAIDVGKQLLRANEEKSRQLLVDLQDALYDWLQSPFSLAFNSSSQLLSVAEDLSE